MRAVTIRRPGGPEVLGWEVKEGSDDDWVTLLPPGGRVTSERPGGSVSLAFQRIDDYVTPTWPGGAHPQQFHLDLQVSDIAAAEPAVLAAGATRHDTQPSEDGGFVVIGREAERAVAVNDLTNLDALTYVQERL